MNQEFKRKQQHNVFQENALQQKFAENVAAEISEFVATQISQSVGV